MLLGRRGLLIRRSLTDGECAHFATWCPAGTAIETLVAVEGRRWAIEDAFETARNELGLDRNETRSPRWSPDHRSSGVGSAASWRLMARLAPPRLAGDAGLCHAGRDPAPGERVDGPKNPDPARPDVADFIRWSVQELRRIAVRLAQRCIQPARVIA